MPGAVHDVLIATAMGHAFIARLDLATCSTLVDFLFPLNVSQSQSSMQRQGIEDSRSSSEHPQSLKSDLSSASRINY